MQHLYLHPNQIITFNDYPVHNEQILKIFFKIYSSGSGHIMPPVPLISIEVVAPHLKNPQFPRFIQGHPEVQYFLLDGSHKTTAATLTHQPIRAMVFQTDQDILDAYRMAETGELFSLTTGKTIPECVRVLKKHFRAPAGFQTILEKTQRMVQDRILPQYMLD